MIGRLKTQETLYPAQHYFQYSNLGFSLAGEIIQERSQQDYRDYIQEHILTPLGLTSTRSYYPEDLHGRRLAIGYTGMDRTGIRRPVKPFFTAGITPAAGFTSSVNDLARFASWQFRLLKSGGEEVLNANTLREMHRVHWVDPDWKTTWGLGFAIRRVEKTTIVGHGGGCPGYITSLSMIPKRDLAVIVLTNAGDGPAGKVAQNTLRVFAKALVKASAPSEDEIPDYSLYEGNYDISPWGGEAAIRQWGDQLVVISIPSNDLSKSMTKLKHESGHRFIRMTNEDEPREPWIFEIGEDGRAKRVFRHSNYLNRIE
jgi:CubicO group peptidase (beta-lactamase class C family)